MCLNKILRILPGDITSRGYKVFRKRGDRYRPMFEETDCLAGDDGYKLGVEYEAIKKKIWLNMGTNYESGFHIFLDIAHARDYKKYMTEHRDLGDGWFTNLVVMEVSFSDVTIYGEQDIYRDDMVDVPCIVASKMCLLREV